MGSMPVPKMSAAKGLYACASTNAAKGDKWSRPLVIEKMLTEWGMKSALSSLHGAKG